MRPPSGLVLGVINDLKGQGIFNNHPFSIEPIRKSIQRLCGGIPIEFWEVEFDATILMGKLEHFDRSSGVYGEQETVALVKYAKSLNLCWRRLVQLKEMCHLWLDANGSYTDLTEKYEGLLERLASAEFMSAVEHEDYLIEQVAVICAIEILLPKELRETLLECTPRLRQQKR